MDSQSQQKDLQQPRKQQQAYKKIKVLGQGSMGKAYLVQCAQDQKYYVMKRINIGHLSQEEKENARRQAQLHSRLSSDHIIAFKQIYHTTKDKLCIIMEYAQNGDLDEFIKKQQGKYLQEQVVLKYFVQICLGLKQIHQKKIVHRDLKGANIFITADDQMKIGDFGISKVIDRTIIVSKSFVGTPYYLSPQMVEGKPFSTKADIWSLGVILYHMCAQKLPFQTNSLPLLALKIIKGSFPPISGGNYSRQIKNLILSLLQVDQKKRPNIEEILSKPLLFKYLPLQLQEKIRQKNSISQIHKKAVSSSNINNAMMGNKPKKKAKPKISEQEMKQLERQKRQDYKQKRQEMRKQMREDLRKKRKEPENTGQQENQSLEINSSSMNLQKKQHPKSASKSNLNKVGTRVSTASSQVKRQQRKFDEIRKGKSVNQVMMQDNKNEIKPWKNKQAKNTKQVEIQLFLPEDRPKQTKMQKVQQPISSTKKDIKVEIFVSGKPFDSMLKGASTKIQQHEKETIKKEIQKIRVESKKQIFEKEQNYHYSKKIIEQQKRQSSCQDGESQDQIQEEIEYHNNYINNILSDVKGVGQLVKNLSNPYGNIELYQQSQNFDQAIQTISKQSHNDEQYENMKYITNATNSQNLQQLRLILQDRLGQENFVKAYNVLIQHSQEAARKQAQRNTDFDQDYTFNREILRQKLNFMTPQQFEKNIVLLYTLTILQDQQMKSNFEDY